MAEEEEKPKILVDAATMVDAITAENWNAEQTKRFNKQGIYRLNEAEMKQKFPETKEFSFASGELTTVLYQVEVKNKEKLIVKDNHSELLPDVYIADCVLGDVELINCNWVRSEPSFLGNTNFYINNSSVGNFSIAQSTIGNFSIAQSTSGYFSIAQSTTGNFSIAQSTTGNFSIEQSNAGDFIIQDKSNTGDFSISGESTTGNFYIYEQSSTGYFSISGQSTTRDFRISGQSTIGNFSISDKSTTGYFSVSGESTTGNFYIDEQSTTGEFSISGESTAGNFYLYEQSTIEDFSVSGRSTIGYFYIQDKSTIGDFSVSGRSTTGYFRISGESTTGYFYIYEQSITGNFYIDEQSTIGEFRILGQSTTGNFSISGGSTTEEFNIEQSTIGEFRILGQSTTGNFSIKNNSTTGDFNITGESKTGNFAIANSYPGNFFIENSSSPLLAVENCFASFGFSKAIIGQCKLTNCQIPQLHIQNQCEMELYVSGGQINHLNFEQLTLGKSSIVSLSSVQVYLCNMFEFTVLGNLYFRDINPAINTVHFFSNAPRKPLYILFSDNRYFRKPNENNIPWVNYYDKLTGYKRHLKELKKNLDAMIVPAPTFRILKSSLGKTEFTECDLKRFRVEYKHSKLTEIFISGGTVPDDDLVIYEADENDADPKKQLEWHEQKAAFFNQLKKVFSQVGNVYRETQYNSLSAKHQLQILRINRRITKGTTQNGTISRVINAVKPVYIWLKTHLPGSNSFDIITFYLNRFSNNHGASWGRAVVFTLLSTVCAYIVYLCSVRVLGYGNDYVFAFDWELVAYYFSFIDITHKPDFMKDYGVELTAFSRVVSFFSRILIGFCIYQFIAAFRRHGKQG